jgi:hypothetical protein
VEPRFSFQVYLCAAVAALVILIEANAQNLPLAFEQNKKQAPAGVRFLTRTHGHDLHFKRNEVEVAFKSGSLLIRFVGANEKAKPEGHGRLDELIRYVDAKKSDEKKPPAFAVIRYTELYPGINLVFYGRRSQVQYEFVIEPEADPKQIRLVVENADRIEIDEKGGLVLGIGDEVLRVPKPLGFPADDGEGQPIDVRYALQGSNEISFELGDYHGARRLTIR